MIRIQHIQAQEGSVRMKKIIDEAIKVSVPLQCIAQLLEETLLVSYFKCSS